MQLKTYRVQNSLTLADMVERLRFVGLAVTNERTVQRHETGARKPSATTVEAYRKATSGAVRFEDWLDLETMLRANVSPTPQKQPETINV
jgi:hypothetical protein